MSPFADQMWEGRMKGAETIEAFLRNERRVVMVKTDFSEIMV